MSAFCRGMTDRIVVGFSLLCFCALGGASYLLSGCRHELLAEDRVAAVKELAEVYWTKRLIENDFKATYEMEVEKDTLSFPEYQKRVGNAGQIAYVSIHAGEVAIEGDRANVKMAMKYRVKSVSGTLFDAQFLDHWVFDNGDLKHVLGEGRRPSR